MVSILAGVVGFNADIASYRVLQRVYHFVQVPSQYFDDFFATLNALTRDSRNATIKGSF